MNPSKFWHILMLVVLLETASNIEWYFWSHNSDFLNKNLELSYPRPSNYPDCSHSSIILWAKPCSSLDRMLSYIQKDVPKVTMSQSAVSFSSWTSLPICTASKILYSGTLLRTYFTWESQPHSHIRDAFLQY